MRSGLFFDLAIELRCLLRKFCEYEKAARNRADLIERCDFDIVVSVSLGQKT